MGKWMQCFVLICLLDAVYIKAGSSSNSNEEGSNSNSSNGNNNNGNNNNGNNNNNNNNGNNNNGNNNSGVCPNGESFSCWTCRNADSQAHCDDPSKGSLEECNMNDPRCEIGWNKNQNGNYKMFMQCREVEACQDGVVNSPNANGVTVERYCNQSHVCVGPPPAPTTSPLEALTTPGGSLTTGWGTTPGGEQCSEPVESGPCGSYFTRYFYNSTSQACETFIYGGCQGNDNNFMTQAECEEACQVNPCEYKELNYLDATNPSVALPVIYTMTGTGPTIDNNHSPVHASMGSGSSYIPQNHVDNPVITFTILNTQDITKLGYFRLATKRVEKIIIQAKDVNDVVTYDTEILDITSNVNLDVYQTVSGFYDFSSPVAKTVTFSFIKCTQDPQKCASAVEIKDFVFSVVVCPDEPPRMCNCSVVGDPLMSQFDNSEVPLSPMYDGEQCRLSFTPAMPTLASDAYCGWMVDSVITTDALNLSYPSGVIADIGYRNNRVVLEIDVNGVTHNGNDVSNHDGGWYTVSTSGGRSVVHVADCQFTLTTADLDNRRTSYTEIIGPNTDSMVNAAGLCGNCNDLMDDRRDANGDIVPEQSFWVPMTDSWCTAPGA